MTTRIIPALFGTDPPPPLVGGSLVTAPTGGVAPDEGEGSGDGLGVNVGVDGGGGAPAPGPAPAPGLPPPDVAAGGLFGAVDVIVAAVPVQLPPAASWTVNFALKVPLP
jgi:hypothetical protein